MARRSYPAVNPARRARAQVVRKTSTLVAPMTPAVIEQGLAQAGMDSTARLGPGRPLNPYLGYSQTPRAMDYPVGVNISTQSRASWGRPAFTTLKAIVDAYDVARMCINHKIDELRSMEPMYTAADGVTDDVDAAIDAAKAAMTFPDRELPFDGWLSKLLEPVLRYDAGALYRRRNLDGDVIGLEVLDGTTIEPYIDEHGRRPVPPQPAFYQRVQGLPMSWYTTDDIVRTLFRPQADSPYGMAAIESVLLTANTDLRFQWHFLQMFTEGSVPAGFVELPPDVTNPDQVAEWQDYWDATVMGDQAKLHQLIAVPQGTKVTETRPKDFDKAFPQYLMTRTAAAFGVTPQDLGLIDDVNRANGETQVDIQFRVNTLPWVRFVEGIVTRYLQHDLGLPVKMTLDTGRDVEDRVAEATAWDTAVKGGAVSVDEWRQQVYGLPVDYERPMPRFIYSPRTGPVPLQSVLAISGKIDPETGAPINTEPLQTAPFEGAAGVLADKSPGGSQFKRAPINPDDPLFPATEHPVPGSDIVGLAPGSPVIGDPGVVPPVPGPLTKDAVTAGVTSATGVVGVDQLGHDDETDDDVDDERVVKAELAAFGRFVKARTKAGKWRPFTFTATDPTTAHRLNDDGRAQVRKAAGDLVAAGLAVRAADTGRVLMLVRALDPEDPAAGKLEFPGGHIEDGETPQQAAAREWSEETGAPLPPFGTLSGEWTSGVYAGFVYDVDTETVPVRGDTVIVNPDDPDGDGAEAILWVDPADLPGNPMLRAELAADLDRVLAAFGPTDGQVPDEAPFEPTVKATWRDTAPRTPQLKYDLAITDHYRPKVAAALRGLVTDDALHAAVTAAGGLVVKDAAADRRRAAQAAADALGDPDQADLEQVIREIIADGYLAGGHAAAEQLGIDVDALPAGWEPGDVDAAIRTADGGLARALDAAGVTVRGIVASALDAVGNVIAGGLLNGDGVEAIAAALDEWSQGSDAERIAHTETARAVTGATMDVYAANGIGQWELLLSDDACDDCVTVADGGPYPVGDTGDLPPVHPYCRCSSSPVTDDTTTATDTDNSDDGSDS